VPRRPLLAIGHASHRRARLPAASAHVAKASTPGGLVRWPEPDRDDAGRHDQDVAASNHASSLLPP
jgi:hypothetical protein